MKARVIKPEKVILYHGISGEKLENFLKLTNEEKIKAVEVTDPLLNQSIGFLAGWKGFSENPQNEVVEATDEVIVMCGIDRSEMTRLLDKLRARKISIMLKAVATPSNQNWKFSELIKELQLEHMNMNG